ncbi:hypothetical protein VKT23_015137 [Stygiomarasmius scandens]|uniref:Uncharacterized protein n=1 Tax=Marasmiellus scandens TaxID=2682957 RepID=A0ABR1J133_9AGAR
MSSRSRRTSISRSNENEATQRDPKLRLVPGPDRTRYDELVEQKRSLEQTVRQFEQRLQENQTRLDRLQKNNADLTVENEGHRESLDLLATDRHRILVEAEHLRAMNGQAQDILTKQQEAIQQQGVEISQKHQEILDLQAIHSSLQAESQRLEAEREVEIAALRSRENSQRDVPLQWLNSIRGSTPSGRRRRRPKTADTPIVARGARLNLPPRQQGPSESGLDADVEMQKDGDEYLTKTEAEAVIIGFLQKLALDKSSGSFSTSKSKKSRKDKLAEKIEPALEQLSDREEQAWRVLLRETFKELTGAPAVNDFRNYEPAEEEEVGRYERSETDGPGNGYRLYSLPLELYF